MSRGVENFMASPLIAKLSVANPLNADDCALIERLTAGVRSFPAHHELTSEGDRPEYVHLIVRGFACRYKVQKDGGRAIMAVLVPGDFCDLHVALLGHMDHSIATLSTCSVVRLSRATVLELLERPRIGRALLWATLVDEAVLRQWVVNLSGREGDERLAHLFCELFVRLRTVGLAADDGYELPMTQNDLADLTGTSDVHVNRVLKDLRERDLVLVSRGRVLVPNEGALRRCCDFDPSYLHLAARDAEADVGS